MKKFAAVQMSLRGGVLLFPTKQSLVLRDVSVENEIASPLKNKISGSQRHCLARYTVENEKIKTKEIKLCVESLAYYVNQQMETSNP